jgi:hypothetical protein
MKAASLADTAPGRCSNLKEVAKPVPKDIEILVRIYATTGKAVPLFGAGGRVFGGTGFKFGAHAEYVCVPEDGAVATTPGNMTP